ncbi:MAG: helix-turn-helix transcriptional regulator [Rhodanobacter sp.]
MQTLVTHAFGRLILQPLLLRIADVQLMVGLSKPTIYRLMQAGKFPAQVKLSASAVGWKFDEVVAWVQDRVRASEAKLEHVA